MKLFFMRFFLTCCVLLSPLMALKHALVGAYGAAAEYFYELYGYSGRQTFMSLWTGTDWE